MFDIYVLFAISALISPVASMITALISILNKTTNGIKYPKVYTLILGSIFLVLGMYCKNDLFVVEAIKYTASQLPYLKGAVLAGYSYQPIKVMFYDYISIGFCLIMNSLFLVLLHQGADEQLITREIKRTKARQKWTKKVDYLYNKNSLIFGVSGSGKGTHLTKTIEQCLIHEPDCFFCVVDGKADVTDKFGFYNTLRILAERSGKQLAVINGTANYGLDCQYTYDPFYGMSVPEEIRDMVLALMFDDSLSASTGSEHYKTMFSRYLLEVIVLMLNHKVPITLFNISQMMNKENLLSFISSSENSVTIQERDSIKNVISACYKDAFAAISKLEMFLIGSGSNIFKRTEGRQVTNSRLAYSNSQLLLILISEMDMPEFAKGLGRLAIMDCRSLIAARMNGSLDKSRSARIILDEFSSYTNSQVLPIFSRARSSETTMYLSTQSISDLSAISESFKNAVFDNTSRFIFFRQNSPESAEQVAALIGTQISTQSTLRSSSGGWSTGEESNRAVREFIAAPDDIKTLPKQHGIVLDKDKKQISYIINSYTNLENGGDSHA